MNPSRLITPVLRVLLVLFAAGPALAETSEPFTFENADIQTVVKQVATVTGITFLFDPEQDRIVDDASVLGCDQHVLALADRAFREIAAGQRVRECRRVGPRDLDDALD